MKERPEFCTEEHLDYLDDLRESGVTNMFGAGAYLRKEFPDLKRGSELDVLSYWMGSFSERKKAREMGENKPVTP